MSNRFYSADSSFVHGGLDQPGESTRSAKGQTEIHKRIMSLNLKECRAKIRQVDSFETVNGGLVIQVIGELGNDGESMRRFVQTFVLAQQSPKAYYVNNDIFRYQDDAFRDEGCNRCKSLEAEVKSVPVKGRNDDAMEATSVQQPAEVVNPEPYTNGSWAEAEEKKESARANHPTAPFSQQGQNAPVRNVTETAAPQQMAFDQHGKQRSRNERPTAAASQRIVTPTENAGVTNAEVASPNRKEVNRNVEQANENRAPAASVPSKPLSFAAVAGGGRTSPTPVPTKTANISKNAASGKSRDKSPERMDQSAANEDHEAHTEGHQQQTGNAGGRQNVRAPGYSNDQQVFVGNLPQDVTDEELQTFMNRKFCARHSATITHTIFFRIWWSC